MWARKWRALNVPCVASARPRTAVARCDGGHQPGRSFRRDPWGGDRERRGAAVLDGAAPGSLSVTLATRACAVFERVGAGCVAALRRVSLDLCPAVAALGAQAASVFDRSIGRK